MENEAIIEILSRWNFWNRDEDTGVERVSYLEELERLSKTQQIVAITGVRRSGKSTLIKQFIKKKISEGHHGASFLYINFEEPKFFDVLSLEFLQQIYEAYLEIVKPKEKPWIFLDEVQNVLGWERFARSIHEKKEAYVFVLGSTSSLLDGELGSLLTGRWLELRMHPLDFKEFLRFKGLTIEKKLDVITNKLKIKQLLKEYLEFGGFPLVALTEEKEEILRRYFDDIIQRDVALRKKIRKPEKLKALAKYYLTNFASRISYRKISNFIGLSLDSTERFSSYLRDAHLIFFVPRFSYSLKEQEVNPRIVYGIDSGLINITGFRFSDNVGKLYENLVFVSLLKMGKEVYYYKNKRECDFIIKEGQRIKEVLQVSYELKENKKREVDGLLEAMEKFKVKKGYVITGDEEAEEKLGGRRIIYLPLWKWLLLE